MNTKPTLSPGDLVYDKTTKRDGIIIRIRSGCLVLVSYLDNPHEARWCSFYEIAPHYPDAS